MATGLLPLRHTRHCFSLGVGPLMLRGKNGCGLATSPTWGPDLTPALSSAIPARTISKLTTNAAAIKHFFMKPSPWKEQKTNPGRGDPRVTHAENLGQGNYP